MPRRKPNLKVHPSVHMPWIYTPVEAHWRELAHAFEERGNRLTFELDTAHREIARVTTELKAAEQRSKAIAKINDTLRAELKEYRDARKSAVRTMPGRKVA